MMGVMLLRMNTYIIGFCFMDCTMLASGLAFNGRDEKGNERHDRVKSVVINGLIFTHKVKNFLQCWNISTHEWLKNYVFLRMLNNQKRGGQEFAALVTFMVSAIWHGFYPGFFSFFFGAFLMDMHNKYGPTVCGPLFKGWCPDIIQNCSITVFYYISCSYFTVAFWLLNFCDFHKVYMDMYYFGHILIISTLLIFVVLTPKRGTSNVKL